MHHPFPPDPHAPPPPPPPSPLALSLGPWSGEANGWQLSAELLESGDLHLEATRDSGTRPQRFTGVLPLAVLEWLAEAVHADIDATIGRRPSTFTPATPGPIRVDLPQGVDDDGENLIRAAVAEVAARGPKPGPVAVIVGAPMSGAARRHTEAVYAEERAAETHRLRLDALAERHGR